MTSFSNYTQHTNCNLLIKNSLIFSLYHKNFNTKLYYKTNNSIKGQYKDPILKDYVYFASNNLKKNSSFRKTEIDSSLKSFVSYFGELENNFSLFNIYPQKYNHNLFKLYLKHQNLIYTWKKKMGLISNKKINSVFLTNYKVFEKKFEKNKPLNIRNVKNLLIANYYNTYYFINKFGFIRKIHSKFFKQKLFTGLLYIFPHEIKNYFKKLFSLNYLILNFFSSLNSLLLVNTKIFKINLILYTIFLKYINSNILSYLSTKKLKMRKGNILLYRYVKIYSRPLTKLINFYYNLYFKKSLNYNSEMQIACFLFDKNVFSIDSSKKNQRVYQILGNEVISLSFEKKITILKIIYEQLNRYRNYNYNFLYTINSLIYHDKIIYQYIGLKLLLIKNYLKIKKYLNFTFNRFIFNNLSVSLNKQIYSNPVNFFSDYNDYLPANNLVYWKSILNKSKLAFYISKNFLKVIKPKRVVNFGKKVIWNHYPSLKITQKQKEKIRKRLRRLLHLLVIKCRGWNKPWNKKSKLKFSKAKAKLKRIRSAWLKVYNHKRLKNTHFKKIYVY